MSKKVEKIKYKFFHPFGPSIMYGTMPPGIFKEFKDIVTNVLEKKEEPHGNNLAGRIDDEWAVPEQYWLESDVGEFLDGIVGQYARELSDRFYTETLYNIPIDPEEESKFQYSVHRTQGWVNSMVSGEYNPLHYHPNCNITTVFFFNDVDEDFLTESIASTQTGTDDVLAKGRTDDGLLEIVYNTAGTLEGGTFRVRPIKGNFLIFPGNLLHVVYPFISAKERITSSVNYIIKSSIDAINFGGR